MLKKLMMSLVVLVVPLLLFAYAETEDSYVASELSLDKQLSAQGGCPECIGGESTTEQPCLTLSPCPPSCEEGIYRCAFGAYGGGCVEDEDPGHWCSCDLTVCGPKVMQNGNCTGPRCGYTGNYGTCDDVIYDCEDNC